MGLKKALHAVFSGITAPIVGIIIALTLYEGIKEGVLVPLMEALWRKIRAKKIFTHNLTPEQEEEERDFVVRSGGIEFKVGYLLSRVVLFVVFILLALVCLCIYYAIANASGKDGSVSPDSAIDGDVSADADVEFTTHALEESLASKTAMGTKAAVASHHHA